MRKIAASTALPPWMPAFTGMTALAVAGARKIRRNALKRLKTGSGIAAHPIERPPEPLRPLMPPDQAVVARRDGGDGAIQEPQAPDAPWIATSRTPSGVRSR